MTGIFKVVTGGKVFIGRSVDLENEWQNQKTKAKNMRTRFYNSLRKDLERGKAQFQIITECAVSDMNQLQERYILKYDSYFNGWNTSLGGDYEWSEK
jgi:hypothetical protein